VIIVFTALVTHLNIVCADSSPDTKTPQQGRVILINGDKLSGQPQSTENGQELLFNSKNLHQSAHFPLSNILSLQLENRETPSSTKALARIQLHPRFNENQGDVIRGEIKELTPESIKLDCWYGGMITLKRSMVKSLKILSVSEGNYHGPINTTEWTKNNTAWYYANNTLVSEGSGGIGKDIGLTEKSHISFDASWRKNMKFKIQLYSSDITSISPSACYEINFPDNNNAFIRTSGSQPLGAGIVGGGRWTNLQSKPKGNQAHFDILIDRKAGSVNIYIDGAQACQLQSQNPDPKNLGKGIAFVTEESESFFMELSNISITPWNGTSSPDALKKLNEAGSATAAQSPHRIILVNGDIVPGTVGVVEDDRMIIETEHTPIRVPIEKIKSLSLGNSSEEPKKYHDDVRAWFHSGGFVTLKLATITNNKITGFNQALGDVTMDLSAFRRVDFHIYDEEAKQQREKLRL